MKKLTVFLASLALVAMTSIAWAVPTWTDSDTFNKKIGYFESFSYSHSLLPTFNPSQDVVTDYTLLISIKDDKDTFIEFLPEIAIVNQPGVLGDWIYNFSYSSNLIGFSIVGLAQLNNSGTLDVKIESLMGDFIFGSSKLTAYDNTPVPEPGTILLLGAGLLGLAVYGKRRMNKE